MINIIKILIFDDVELLDFCGPLEVFSVARYFFDQGKLDVSTVAYKEKIIVSKSKIEIIPNGVIDDGKIDLLVIPGGIGTRLIIKDKTTLGNIDKLIKKSKIIATVCTGALILAKLGYLKEMTAITHKNGIKELKEIDPSINVDESKRFIDHDKIITSAGISAGIDMSLYLVEKFFGQSLRKTVAEYMEYQY